MICASVLVVQGVECHNTMDSATVFFVCSKCTVCVCLCLYTGTAHSIDWERVTHCNLRQVDHTFSSREHLHDLLFITIFWNNWPTRLAVESDFSKLNQQITSCSWSPLNEILLQTGPLTFLSDFHPIDTLFHFWTHWHIMQWFVKTSIFGWWNFMLMDKCLTCPFEVRRNRIRVITTKKNKTSVYSLAPKSSSVLLDVFSGVPPLSGRTHNCAVASFLLSVPPVKIFLRLSLIPLPSSPVRCQQVPVLSGCLHILSFNWNTTSPLWQLCLSFIFSLQNLTVSDFFSFLSAFHFPGYHDWGPPYQQASQNHHFKSTKVLWLTVDHTFIHFAGDLIESTYKSHSIFAR